MIWWPFIFILFFLATAVLCHTKALLLLLLNWAVVLYSVSKVALNNVSFDNPFSCLSKVQSTRGKVWGLSPPEDTDPQPLQSTTNIIQHWNANSCSRVLERSVCVKQLCKPVLRSQDVTFYAKGSPSFLLINLLELKYLRRVWCLFSGVFGMKQKQFHSPRNFLERSHSTEVAELAHMQTTFVAQTQGGWCWEDGAGSAGKWMYATLKHKLVDSLHSMQTEQGKVQSYHLPKPFN